MIEVTCAIIVAEDGKVLVAQRSESMSHPLKMEFPGGKIESAETAEQCLIREIKEELDVDIQILSELNSNQHAYPGFSVNLIPFVCRITGGEIVLKEHAAYAWLDNSELPDLDWVAADVPVVMNYLNHIDTL
ncbi:(deoxy)nucleoside triphosphate pyrophosphohydrolase [Pedobacter nyackensis]|uniref:8-oxo-dGTP diphosphatase n=1 Tax=Pedobacter nyackensis TaxID=475255 RepID=A0A1W2EU70_9SPHI|nr:(deoxy)nucleoside triphosphate pyrophosphohydrolase [Pedobacter nyackensis]SMD12766.1 8-oxo-dGTP diphosphatase [Pedobacter nyackensis]